MRVSVWLGSLVMTAALWGQPQRGMYGGISTGRMVGSISDPGFASRLGATVSGLPQTSGQAVFPHGPNFSPSSLYPGAANPYGGYGRGGGRPRTVVVPYGVPVFYGGGYGAGYGAAYPADYNQPSQTIVQQVQPSPSVIINQYYTPDVVRPQMKEYSDLPEAGKAEAESPVKVYPPPQRTPAPREEAQSRPAEPVKREDERATITLLAFNDSSVVAAIGYWAQQDTLHYVTNGFVKKTAPLSSLDKSLSEQLNRERKVEFKLEDVR